MLKSLFNEEFSPSLMTIGSFSQRFYPRRLPLLFFDPCTFSRRFYPKRLTISTFVIRSETIYRGRYSGQPDHVITEKPQDRPGQVTSCSVPLHGSVWTSLTSISQDFDLIKTEEVVYNGQYSRQLKRMWAARSPD